MKFFTECSGECCVCRAGDGGCLAGHGDDDYSPATKEQVIKRLDYCEYGGSNTGIMKDYLKTHFNYDYDKTHCCTTAEPLSP